MRIQVIKYSSGISMSKNSKLVLLRLQKEEHKLQSDPLEQAWVAREGVLGFHFCLHGLDGAFSGGFYHGVLQLSEEYPFAPPELRFFTPSGRFEVDKPICTSFTNYHKESWASSWNVRTMIIATISFMNSEEPGAGYLNSSYLTRRQFAKESHGFNLKSPLFRELFKKQLKTISRQQALQQTVNSEGAQTGASEVDSPKESFVLYFLYALLIVILIGWGVMKGS